MFYTTYESPLGRIILAANKTHVTHLHMQGDRYFKGVPDDWVQTSDNPVLAQATSELDEYFKGTRSAFTVPTSFEGSPFQQRVWNALAQIPRSTTVTYSELATRIGSPAAVRAVGTAVGKNPICIIVPCHRVVASSGGLGGYVAGIARKQQLLALEGAENPSSI